MSRSSRTRAARSERIRVAYQGVPGAYSEVAVRKYFGLRVYPVPCASFGEVFSRTEAGDTPAAVVPVENSTEGGVTEVWDRLDQGTLYITGEVVCRVSHCLLALPSAHLEDLREAYSHPQALAQCRTSLERLGLKPRVTYDTAGSALRIRNERLRRAGAVASEEAGRRYGLRVLVRGLEDAPHNATRFAVLRKEPNLSPGARKTSLVFSVPHRPGALCRALVPFAKEGVDLLFIQSRPSRNRPWQYRFFIDLDSHPGLPACRRALDALNRQAQSLRLLGFYRPAIRHRAEPSSSGSGVARLELSIRRH